VKTYPSILLATLYALALADAMVLFSPYIKHKKLKKDAL